MKGVSLCPSLDITPDSWKTSLPLSHSLPSTCCLIHSPRFPHYMSLFVHLPWVGLHPSSSSQQFLLVLRRCFSLSLRLWYLTFNWRFTWTTGLLLMLEFDKREGTGFTAPNLPAAARTGRAALNSQAVVMMAQHLHSTPHRLRSFVNASVLFVQTWYNDE